MHTLIFLNGDPPGNRVVNYFLKNSCFIIAADGGANYLKKIKVIPDVILGDLDSIKMSSLTYFRNKTKIVKISEQYSTDFEKSLRYCINNKKDNIVVFGSTGNRSDHTLNNFSILKRYYRKLDIKLISDEFEIFFIKKNIVFDYRKNEVVSLIAMPKAMKINSTGLKYKLKDLNLELGKKEGALNQSVGSEVSINFVSGSLLLFKKHFVK